MLDTINKRVQELAGEAYGAFERVQRGDETITVPKGDRPEWVYDAIYSAHGDLGPDDWRYDAIRAAFGAIHDAGDDADMQDVGGEYADAQVDVYTGARLQWLASNLNRVAYVDDAMAEFGGPSENDGIVGSIGLGQYMEAREVFAAVVEALEERLEELDGEDDEA